MAPANRRAVTESGLRGRGGAAFPAGIKWQTVLDAVGGAEIRRLQCRRGRFGHLLRPHADGGRPFCLLEGMAIAGLAVGATQGYIYVRSEYPHAIAALRSGARARARAAGRRALGKASTIEVRKGAGSYICGEETALLESLEGKRGIVRAKPPLPAIAGLFGKPTVINNVITFASVPDILAQGARPTATSACGRSRGTLPFQLAGNIKHGGLVEVPFGLTLRELLYDFGGGSRSGRPLRAVQVGGPLGAYLPESQFDTPLDYEAFAAIGAGLGHGGIVAFDDTVDMAKQARYAMEFCAIESCGKCTPCRIGSTRGVEVIDRIVPVTRAGIALLEDLCETMTQGSLCAMGSMTPIPVLSALRTSPRTFGGNANAHQGNSTSARRRRWRHGDVWRSTASRQRAGGTSVLRAAAEAGVAIPKLCATDILKPFGSCRLCLVEIEGRKGYPSSCTTPAEAGMKVRTQSPQLAKLRRNVMELYISDHPLTA
jgi:formate dehydrogenase iron-sulfur subunit